MQILRKIAYKLAHDDNFDEIILNFTRLARAK